MKYKFGVLLLVGVILLQACSVRKNTTAMRAYQELNTKYNVNFNGYESLNEGLKILKNSHEDDYSEVLPIFPFDESMCDLVRAQMSRAQDKGEKAIKRHSIKQKPSKDAIKYREDPKYYAFYNQEEFNKQLDKSWMLLGQAQFYQGDFMRAIGTFAFIADKYQTSPIINSEALIWKARCYSELTWYLESEMLLKQVNKDGFPDEMTNWYTKVLTDLFIKERKYKEAIPPLLKTISNESDRSNKLRYRFILAQIYQELKQNDLAFEEYSLILKKFPTQEIEINARIKRAEVMETGDYRKIYKRLKRLLKNHKEDEYSCRIFYALGNVSLVLKDTSNAINYYEQALDVKKKDERYLGLTDLALGNIYSTERRYREAATYYTPSVSHFKEHYRDYKSIKALSSRYEYFQTVYDAVNLQDSLNHLASLPESERNAIIDQQVSAVSERLKMLKNQASTADTNTNVPTELSAQPTDAAAWYFYNPTLVGKGKEQFQNTWGHRTLADAWNTTNSIGGAMDQAQTAGSADDQEENSDSIVVNRSQFTKDIPLTADAKKKSQSKLELNLLSLAYSYQYDIKDYPLSIQTFKRYEELFDDSPQMGSVYYALYMLNDSIGNSEASQLYKNKLLDQYSNTRFGLILTDPNYIGKIATLNKQEQTSYQRIYDAFVADQPNEVINQSFAFKNTYPASAMTSQVLYMEAIAKGKQGNMTGFVDNLQEISQKHAEDDIAPLANSVLNRFENSSLKDSIQQLPSGTNFGLLDERNQEIWLSQQVQNASKVGETKVVQDEEFTYNPREKHLWAIWIKDTTNLANNVLYATARLNFTRFENEGYSMRVHNLRKPESLVLVGGFSDHQDALSYGGIFTKDSTIQSLLKGHRYEVYTISEKNMHMLASNKKTTTYLWFYNKYYLGREAAKPQNDIALPTINVGDTLAIDNSDSYSFNDSLEYKTEVLVENSKGTYFKGFLIEDDSTANYYGIAYWGGSVNLDSMRRAVNRFMTKYDPSLKVTVQLRSKEGIHLILIGSLGNKKTSLKCLYEIVNDADIKKTLSTAVDYRNALITKKNAELLMKNRNIKDYSEFFKKIYMGN